MINLVKYSNNLAKNIITKRVALPLVSIKAEKSRDALSLRDRSSSMARKQSSDDEGYSDFATSFIRSMGREFDYVRRRMEQAFGDLTRFGATFPDEKDLITVDKEGNKKFQLAFDMSEFDPENIKVKIRGNNLVVSAKKEKKSSDSYYLNEFSQSYALPDDVKPENFKSRYIDDDSILIIEGELPKMKEEKLESGTHQKKERDIKIDVEGENQTEKSESRGKVSASSGSESQTIKNDQNQKKPSEHSSDKGIVY